MIEQGTLSSVTRRSLGSALNGDHAAGVTVLLLWDVSDFADEGGLLSIDGADAVAYTAVDADLSTVTLAAPLAADGGDGASVELSPLTYKVVASVILDSLGSEAITDVRVPFNMRAQLPLGLRAEGEREVVTMDRTDSDDWTLVDVVDEEPSLDASSLTGELPQDIKDQVEGGGVTPVAPESSPVPTVDGFAGLLLSRWLGVLNETAVMYDIHVSASNASDPSESTLLDSTASTIYSIRTLPNGSALLYDTTYYVAIWARSDDQYAPAPSAWVPGVMDKTRSADIAAGAIDGMTITGATIRSAATGQRIQFDSEALKAFAPDGTTVTAMLEAVAGALRLQGGLDLNANGELNIYDTAPDVGSRLTVSNGRLTVFYDGAEVGSIDAEFNGSANVARIFHNADSVSLGFEADNVYVGVSSPQVAVGTSAGAVTVGQAADNVDVGYSAGTDTHVGGGGAGSTTTVGFLGDSTSIRGGTVALGEVGGIVQLLGQRLRSLADPTASTDAATKNYVDTRKVTDLAAPTANFSMNSRKITNLADATAATDAVNLGMLTARQGFVRRDISSSQNFANNSEAYVALTASTETDGSWTYTASGNPRIICQAAGVYTLTFTVSWAANATGRRTIIAEINGGRGERIDQLPGGSFQVGQQIVVTRRCLVGDTVSLVGFQTAGTTLAMTLAYVTAVKVGI